MGGRVIQCLRAKYVDTPGLLNAQCVAELIDVIQTSKIDIKIDVQLYQNCRQYLTQDCTGVEQEDCLKLKFQRGQIDDVKCKEQVKRIIREGQADIHVDRALAFSCQADILKYCNDIPIGSGKQLQCLLNMQKSVTPQCQKMLQDREELWNSVIDSILSIIRFRMFVFFFRSHN
jgi:Golgi apparatus protein 1